MQLSEFSPSLSGSPNPPSANYHPIPPQRNGQTGSNGTQNGCNIFEQIIAGIVEALVDEGTITPEQAAPFIPACALETPVETPVETLTDPAFEASVDALVDASWPKNPNGETVITYSFIADEDVVFADEAFLFLEPNTENLDLQDIDTENPELYKDILSALKQWDDASGISFVPAPPGEVGMINYSVVLNASESYANSDMPPHLGDPELEAQLGYEYGNFPNAYDLNGVVNVEFVGLEGIYAAMHETGHALGLKHSFSENFMPYFSNTSSVAPGYDSGDKTVMSYNYHAQTTLGPLDIASAVELYGEDDTSVQFEAPATTSSP